MTNKNIAWATVIGMALVVVNQLGDSGSEGIIYWAGILVFYYGVVYGTVRLFKSND